MRWNEKDKYYIQSTCRRFNISKSKMKNKWRYSLWRLSDKQHLGVFDNADDAKLLAEEYDE